jgi:hypothetical protein
MYSHTNLTLLCVLSSPLECVSLLPVPVKPEHSRYYSKKICCGHTHEYFDGILIAFLNSPFYKCGSGGPSLLKIPT